jgi:hypothetical protein
MDARPGNHTPAVTVCEIDFDSASEAKHFLLRSDAHHDSTAADQEMEMRHLLEAEKRDALICDAGDLFDCMNGRYDKRADREHLRPEYQHGSYMNRLIDVATARYERFAPRWLHMSPGNHETAVAKHNDFDLAQQLYARLKPSAPFLNLGKYQGYIRIHGRLHGRDVGSVVIAYHHGFGGSAPVTRGVIQTNRMAIAYPDADIVWAGHTHTEYYLSIARMRLSHLDTVRRDEQIHIRSPGYKEDTTSGSGWAVEKGFMPQSLGAWWLRVWPIVTPRSPNRTSKNYRLAFSLEAAK